MVISYDKARNIANLLAGMCLHHCGQPAVTADGLCAACREKSKTRNRDRYRLQHGIPLTNRPWQNARFNFANGKF